MNSEESEWRQFIQVCRSLKSAEDLNQFFDLLFTIEEKKDFLKRFQVIDALLKDEMPQRQIASKLGVSIFKITRGSNALKIVDPKLKDFLRKQS